MAQQGVEKVGLDKHNFARTGRMALYGGGNNHTSKCGFEILGLMGEQLSSDPPRPPGSPSWPVESTSPAGPT